MASIALISLLALGSAFAAHRPQLAANPPVLSLSSSSAAPPSAVPTPLVNPAQPDVISATNNYTVPESDWRSIDLYMQDHIRFHCYLSMAAYGDPATTCANTFTAAPTDSFAVLEQWNATTLDGKHVQVGYSALITLMQKVTLVFRGSTSTVPMDWTPVPFTEVPTCVGCLVAKGVLDLYQAAKLSTSNFAIAKAEVLSTGQKFSTTGHGIGGCVAQLAAIDLGSQSLVHYSHSQGAPRCMNQAAVSFAANIFQGESQQIAIAENDFFPWAIPLSFGFVHSVTAIWLFGSRIRYMQVCYYDGENPACLGDGSSINDHYYYFTPMGQCGAADKGF